MLTYKVSQTAVRETYKFTFTWRKCQQNSLNVEQYQGLSDYFSHSSN